jgi:hypothetical protein
MTGVMPSPSYLAGIPISETVVAPFPPIAERITVGRPDDQGYTVITGTAGAVLPGGIVAVVCLDTAVATFLMAEADGSFVSTLYAPQGTSVQVKHVYPFIDLAEIEATFGGTISGDIMAGWMNATPGTILPVLLDDPGPVPGVPFGFAGTIAHEEGAGFWSMHGIFGPEQSSGGDLQFPITSSLIITTPALTSGMDLSGVTASGAFRLRRFFDENGQQVPINQFFVSDFMAPTGLPISRGTLDWSPVTTSLQLGSWSQMGDNRLRATVTATLAIPAGMEAGIYRPRLDISVQGVPLGPSNLRTMRPGFVYGTNGLLPIIRVGDPSPPRLLWSLLTDTLSDGTRGTLARQDKPVYGFNDLTVLPSDTFVIPRIDARTGTPITYRLEPFLPLISLTDRGTANPPLIPFQLPSGELHVEVLRPDGSVENLGPAPFQQSTNSTPAFVDAKLRDNDGGAMQDVYQLATMDAQFAHAFDQVGHHVITMTGFIEDIWGNVYHGSGVYDLQVARSLKLESGQLPTTPYEQQDAFSPGLHIYPPVAADVEMRFTLLPFSDKSAAVSHVISGTANRFGYFAPSIPPVTMIDPGEYRVDITAVYADHEETLWVGSATWGNVVERPGTPIIAHGRRGLDVQEVTPTLWFEHDKLGFNGVGHTNYPYYSGDIFWGQEGHTAGGDSILPEVTIEDTGGGVYQIIQQRWMTGHSTLTPWESLQDLIDADEAPLFSSTSDGSELHWNPERVDQVGYVYCSSQRPGARVHEAISEGCGGIQYWRFNATYGDQAGYEGDLPNDLKWEFGGAVFRLITNTNPINEYAIYGSLWVLLADGDPIGPRVTPPFRGSGALNGGPILTLKGEEIDLFFMPRGVQPGDVLEIGDQFSFSGHVGPPLSSHVAVTVTSPSGGITDSIRGRANKVGWFYQPNHTFPVEEPGVWTVEVHVYHDQPLPSGLTPTGHNSGGVLGAAGGRYQFYVVDQDAPRLAASSPQPGFLSWPSDPVTGQPITVTNVPIVLPLPPELTNAELFYTIRMPGFILETGNVTPTGNSFTINYDPLALHQDFPNLDLTAWDADHPGLADPVLVTFLVAGERLHNRVYQAGAVFFSGDEVHTPSLVLESVYLPVTLKGDLYP